MFFFNYCNKNKIPTVAHQDLHLIILNYFFAKNWVNLLVDPCLFTQQRFNQHHHHRRRRHSVLINQQEEFMWSAGRSLSEEGGCQATGPIPSGLIHQPASTAWLDYNLERTKNNNNSLESDTHSEFLTAGRALI